MLKVHNAVTPVRLEPAALRSRVKHSTTEPLRSHVPGGEGLVVVWSCISYDYKVNLITIPGTLNVHKYWVYVLKPSVVPHFDDHLLASR